MEHPDITAIERYGYPWGDHDVITYCACCGERLITGFSTDNRPDPVCRGCFVDRVMDDIYDMEDEELSALFSATLEDY